jgi:thioredoxin-like negative regulator of GroEL
MLIPEYKKEAPTCALTNLTDLDQYKKLRAATTDKVICVLFVADWDDSSNILKKMVEERVSQNIGANTILFNLVDCDAGEDLVEHFDIESVPSLVLVLPHK